MSDAPAFEKGQPVMDRQDRSEVGHVDDIGADGWLPLTSTAP